jgi:acetylxylan esterase
MRALAILALSARGLGSALQNVAPRTTCDDVHLFLARGNNEPYPGRQGAVVDAMCSGLSSCGYEDIQFSAGLTDNYCDSIYQGATNGIAQLNAYYAQCPNSKLVLSGYSEGANVVGDILGGGGGLIWGECTEGWVNGLEYGVGPSSQSKY